jgi:hypothetical protein
MRRMVAWLPVQIDALELASNMDENTSFPFR